MHSHLHICINLLSLTITTVITRRANLPPQSPSHLTIPSHQLAHLECYPPHPSQNSIHLPSRSPSPASSSHYTHSPNNCRPSANLPQPQSTAVSLPNLAHCRPSFQTFSRRAPLASEACLRTNHTCASRDFLRRNRAIHPRRTCNGACALWLIYVS